MKVVIINGYPQSGKDTFIDQVEILGGDLNLSIARVWASTPAKYALTELGWEGDIKSEEIRRALAILKDLSDVLFDGTAKHLTLAVNELRGSEIDLLFIHARKPSEIARFKKMFDAKTLLIDRHSVRKEYNNDSDNNVLQYDYDYTIPNNGSIICLKSEAYEWLLKEVL